MTSPNREDDVTAGFSERERAAMKQRAEELRAEGRGGKKKADDYQDVLDAIAAMDDEDRVIAERLHSVISRVAPHLAPRTWYGFPAYADGKTVVCFFTSREKGNTRYAVLGFNDIAQLDDGPMWPTSFAITDWTPDVETRVEELLRTATS